MARRMKLEGHLSSEQLKARYKACEDPLEKERWQSLWLISTGKLTREVAEAVGRHPQTVRETVWKFNGKGPSSVMDQRKLALGGNEPLLDQEGLNELVAALKEPPEDHGIWDGPKVAKWISKRLGRKVCDMTGLRYLRKAGLTPQSPRPRSSKADPEAQEAFKKGARPEG